MKKFLTIIALCAAISAAGCSAADNSSAASGSVTDSAVSSDAPSDSDVSGGTPLTAADLKDGSYEITVDSSSTMFNITQCTLNVSDGKMKAVMTMHGKGYLYLFMGKGENAVESEYIPFVEDADGAHTFTVPVEALDTPVDCAAFSKNKEKWYDRTLIFRSDLIPGEAFAEGVLTTAATLGLSDGEYTVEAVLSGGSGRATVQSPAKLTVSGGAASAEIVWSSPNYDYMRVGGEKYLQTNTEGNSAFVIPVQYFDREITVFADTTAMSEPHEIEYKLTFDSSSVK